MLVGFNPLTALVQHWWSLLVLADLLLRTDDVGVKFKGIQGRHWATPTHLVQILK